MCDTYKKSPCIQMILSFLLPIKIQKFLDGWTEWDEWSPCKVTCGIGQSGLNLNLKKFGRVATGDYLSFCHF